MPADAPDTSAFVSPDVVAQALGPALAPDERVIEAAFVVSLEGRGMATAAPVRTLVFVTDRRIAKVAAWEKSATWEVMIGADPDYPAFEWESGTLLGRKHRLTRRHLWLGEVREAAICPERWRRREALILPRFDGSRVRVRASLPVLGRLDAAVGVALTGPGRWARSL